VKKVTSTGTTVFVYDAAGMLMAEYSTESPQPGAGGTKYLTTDSLGSPRAITDKDGRVVSRHDYAPYGEELFQGRTGEYQQDSVRQQFTGQERDKESGLDYFDARYYSSTQGRFTSIDPLAASGLPGRPQSWNRYAYVLNNPLNLVDPTGMVDCPAGQTCSDWSPRQQLQPETLTGEDPTLWGHIPIPVIDPGGWVQSNPDAVVDIEPSRLWWNEPGASPTVYNTPQQLGVAKEFYKLELGLAVADSSNYWTAISETGSEARGTIMYLAAELPLVGKVIDAAKGSNSQALLGIAGIAKDQVEAAGNVTARNATYEQRFVDAGIPRDRAQWFMNDIREKANSRGNDLVMKDLGIEKRKGSSGWPIYADFVLPPSKRSRF
jgi:RHS repeat-associated protein